MLTLYLLEQGSTASLRGEQIQVQKLDGQRQNIGLPHLQLILVFGAVHLSTGLIRACLREGITIAYLSRQGRCYGRLMPTMPVRRSLRRQQFHLSEDACLNAARSIVQAKLLNARVLLLRAQRRHASADLQQTINALDYFAERATRATDAQQLRGYEGAAAASYFPAFGQLLTTPGFVMVQRSRRPPLNPVNALLSFGYQLLWNHILARLELAGFDTYAGVFHVNNDRHPSLASDLIEEFRAPIIDSLVLWLINSRVIHPDDDFDYADGGCFLQEDGRRKYLRHFVQRMNETIQINGDTLPRWEIIGHQIELFSEFIFNPSKNYQGYRIR